MLNNHGIINCVWNFQDQVCYTMEKYQQIVGQKLKSMENFLAISENGILLYH